MRKMPARNVDSPIGALNLRAENGAIVRISFGAGEESPGEEAVLDMCAAQLKEYFAGERREFTVPVAPAGTDFQRRVWEELRKIPYGETAAYSEIAERAGSPRAARAVGMANHVNPIPVIIPCHRVVGKGGALTGYAGGLDTKEKLLSLEKKDI